MGFLDNIMGSGKSKLSLFSEQQAPIPQKNIQQQPQTPVPVQEDVLPQEQSSNSSGIYDARLEKLIDAALADGELTEKEKQVLFKKAESMGIDLDEFEMVLDAKLYEMTKKMQQQAIAAPTMPPVAPTSAPSSNKYGDVKKCPSCGAMIETYTTRCPDCGHEFRGVEANVTIQKLFHILDDIDKNMHAREIERQRIAIERESNKTMFGKFFSELEDTSGGYNSVQVNAEIRKKKIETINTFPIPTTKEDILEFLILAIPLAKKPSLFSSDKDQKEMYPIWRKKCEQIIMKAKFSMKDDKELMGELMRYAKELNITI